MYTQDPNEGSFLNFIILATAVALCVLYCRRRQLSTTAFGTAVWAYDELLRRWGMLSDRGLILGRTLSGSLIRIPRYTHVLLIGGTGSGKGVGLIIPNMLSYADGSVICFDPKGELYRHTSKRRARMGRIIRLSPFGKGGDRWNMLDTIPKDSLLIDRAKALAESLVVRPPTGSSDPHWDSKAAQIITAVLVFVLTRLPDAERNLNSLHDIVSDPAILNSVAHDLKEMGGIPGRLGGQISSLFNKDGILTKEGSGVMSTVARHLDFLNSESVAASVAESTFEVRQLLKPGTTLFLQIPETQLDAQKGLLRCWVSTLIREIGEMGSEENGEVLMMLDEASVLSGLAGVEQALVMGRSAGVRLLLAYQSDAQVIAAFRDKPSLLYDNCSSQIYLGASSLETAERLSKMLGSWTQGVESLGDNWGESRSAGREGGHQVSRGGSSNLAPQARPLLYPDEILRLSNEYMIAFLGGFPAAIFAKRIKWYSDHAFNPAVPKPPWFSRIQWVRVRPKWLAFGLVVALFFGVMAREKSQRQFVPDQPVWRYEPRRSEPKMEGGLSPQKPLKAR